MNKTYINENKDYAFILKRYEDKLLINFADAEKGKLRQFV